MSHAEKPQTDRGTLLAEKRTELAIKRSTIAAERTLMAWIRTAISMIGFGFTIYKFFQYLPSDLAKGNLLHPDAPHNLGARGRTVGRPMFIEVRSIKPLALNPLGTARFDSSIAGQICDSSSSSDGGVRSPKKKRGGSELQQNAASRDYDL